MLGNVYEWTGDGYAAYAGAATDPTGPAAGGGRVSRGGSWIFYARNARAADRDFYGPAGRTIDLGLRLAKTAP